MGVYTAGITLPSLPIILPRLSVYITAETARENPFKKLNFKILRDDGVVFATLEQQIPDQDVLQNIHPDITKNFITLVITLNGIEIPLGCKYLNILVETESETLEGPKLWLTVNSDAFSTPQNNESSES
jgi:hypothetical protein